MHIPLVPAQIPVGRDIPCISGRKRHYRASRKRKDFSSCLTTAQQKKKNLLYFGLRVYNSFSPLLLPDLHVLYHNCMSELQFLAVSK